MRTDAERAASDAWQCLADSCLEHDCAHEKRALTELDRLHQLPQQRGPTERSVECVPAPSDADLARQTAHTAGDWSRARARLSHLFDEQYENVARIAVLSLRNSVAFAADDVGMVLGLPRPQGWRPE